MRSSKNFVMTAHADCAGDMLELENIRKVFALYVAFPKSRWGEIRKAEKDDVLYHKLIQEDNVIAIVGNLDEQATLFISELTQKHRVPFFNSASIDLSLE